MNNLELLMAEMEKYQEQSFEDNIENRLKKTLQRYSDDIDQTCDKVILSDYGDLIKELSR